MNKNIQVDNEKLTQQIERLKQQIKFYEKMPSWYFLKERQVRLKSAFIAFVVGVATMLLFILFTSMTNSEPTKKAVVSASIIPASVSANPVGYYPPRGAEQTRFEPAERPKIEHPAPKLDIDIDKITNKYLFIYERFSRRQLVYGGYETVRHLYQVGWELLWGAYAYVDARQWAADACASELQYVEGKFKCKHAVEFINAVSVLRQQVLDGRYRI